MAEAPIRSEPLWLALADRAGRQPLSPALVAIASGEEWSYARLLDDVESRAHDLRAAGVRPGSTVVLALPNAPEFVLVFYALARLRATVVLASCRHGSSEVASVLAQARPDAWLVPGSPGPGYLELQRTRASLSWCVISRDLHAGIDDGARATPVLDDEDAVVKFTSGSTGEPKGIRLTAPQLRAEAEQVQATLALEPSDRTLALVPLSHSYGFDLGVLATLLAGGTLAISDALALPVLVREFETRRPQLFLGVPLMYRILLEGPRDIDLGPVRWLLSCTAPLPPATIPAFHARFGGVICQHYGSSETGALANHRPEEALRRIESVGRAMSGVRLRVLDPAGRECAPGEEGEVVAESAAIARGYLQAPPGPSPFRSGRYHTGDLGVLDADGYLTLRGRLDRILNVGGLKVSPLEVARVLEEHAAVREAFVFGAPNAMGEEVVRAMVTLRGDASEADLVAHCRSRLAPYKVPRRIEIRDAMPVGPTGKVRAPSVPSES